MAAYITLIVALAGFVLYLLASNPKAVRIGEIMFFCGLLAFCFRLANEMKRLF